MQSLTLIETRNKNLNVLKNKSIGIVNTFKNTLIEMCPNIHSINENLFPHLYRQGVQVFSVLDGKEKTMFSHWYK